MPSSGGTVEVEAVHVTVTRHYRNHQKAQPTCTNPIASIYTWTRGLIYRGKMDGTPDLVTFAETVEKVCVNVVESGKMTKDLAILISDKTPYLTTEQYLDTVDAELKKRMGSYAIKGKQGAFCSLFCLPTNQSPATPLFRGMSD